MCPEGAAINAARLEEGASAWIEGSARDWNGARGFRPTGTVTGSGSGGDLLVEDLFELPEPTSQLVVGFLTERLRPLALEPDHRLTNHSERGPTPLGEPHHASTSIVGMGLTNKVATRLELV